MTGVMFKWPSPARLNQCARSMPSLLAAGSGTATNTRGITAPSGTVPRIRAERYRAIRLTKVDRRKLARDHRALTLLAEHLARTRAFVALVLVGSA